jgi:hypothetical protein
MGPGFRRDDEICCYFNILYHWRIEKGSIAATLGFVVISLIPSELAEQVEKQLPLITDNELGID